MTPRVGDLYWDRDDRVTSRYAKVVMVKDSGAVVIRRGRDGQGRQSTVRADNLRRRFIRLDERGEMERS